MRRHRNSPQMKEQEESPEKELSEIEASNLTAIKFKVMAISMDKAMKKNIETIKKDHSEMMNTISEMKNTM